MSPPRGRRPGETRTREAILDAARRSFARAGYDRTTIRAIAREAGVDHALVLHFFSGKEELFAAAMELPFDAERSIDRIFERGREHLGEGMMRLFFDVWEDPETGPRMVGMLRSAASFERAAERLRERLETRIVHPLADALEVSEPLLRASLVSSQLTGLGVVRYVLGLEPVASAPVDVLIASMAPTLQRYLSEEPLFTKR